MGETTSRGTERRTDRAEPLKVFISYSRDDTAFAEELVSGLEFDGGFDVLIDQRDIHEGEIWQDRLRSLILSSDAVVFVMTPSSVSSDVCQWEVEEAVANSKKVVPALAAPVANSRIPKQLSELNYVRFDEGRSFMTGLFALRRALNVDLDWIREHTRLQERAREWDSAGRLPNRMLSGPDIFEAKGWLDSRPPDAPAPTDLHREYILASERAETDRVATEKAQLAEIEEAQIARAAALADRETALAKLSRRTTLGLGASGGLTVVASGLAYWGYDAEARFRREQELAAEVARRRGAERTNIVGQVVAYAASPGQLAQDGEPGQNSPYTEVVLKALANPNASFQSALNLANSIVLDSSNYGQRPFYSTDMNGEIYPLRQPATRKRKALCVSIGKLGGSTFPNTERDANAWGAFLEKCGFEVQIAHEPTKAELIAAIDAIQFPEPEDRSGLDALIHKAALVPVKQKEPENTLAVFFLAGAGMSARGSNYLALADTIFEHEGESIEPAVEKVIETSIAVQDITQALRTVAAASVVVLDTGFWDPFKPTR